MKEGEMFFDDIKNLLSNRKRIGGLLFKINREDFFNHYDSDLRDYMVSVVLEYVGKQNFCYIKDKSTKDNLLFLDVSRGIKINNDYISILGYYYENNQVVSYVIEEYNKIAGNNE